MPVHPSEFEEKEFEAPLYNQLECGTRLVWSPGQVFEQYVGIDRALFLFDPALWRFFGVSARPRGIYLHRFDWPFWRERPRRPLPTFRVNLFIQAKRNYYHSRLPRTLRGRMSSRTCWHFDINTSQQEALGAVAEKVRNRAVVCYAAPAFHRFSELNAHAVRGTIIQQSTFPLAQKLDGHSSFYYCAPGGSGVANPDIEDIGGEGLEELLRSMRADAGEVANETNTVQLQLLSREIENVIREVPESNSRRAIFFQRIREAERLADDEGIDESGRAFLRVASFASTFNLDWYVVNPNG